MDGRVGIGRTLARACGFLFGHIVDIVGLSWLCAVFYGAAVFLLVRGIAASLLAATPATALFNQFTLPYFLGLLIVTAFFGAAIAIALTLSAAGRQGARAGAYFVIGAKEARLFLALLRLYIVALPVTFAAGYLASQAGAAVATRLPPVWLGLPASIWLDFIAGLIALGVFFVIEARFGFFLAPLASAGERPLLRRAWRLSRGNGLAVFATSSALLLFLFALLALAYWTFSDANFNATLIAQHDDQTVWQALHDNAGILAVVAALGLTVLNALFAGASASAYAAVRADPERPDVQGAEQSRDYEPAPTAAEAARIVPGFDFRSAGEPYAPAMRPVEPQDVAVAPQIANVITEPVVAEPPAQPIQQRVAEASIPPFDPAGALAVEAARAIPPPSSSAARQSSPEPAPSEAV